VPTDPISVRWTLHALDKTQKLGFARLDVESVLLTHHRERRRNAGRARWRVAAGRLVIAYEHPDGDDLLAARIVTVWRRR
jgi:predicted secreted Zn-dependent protease